MKEMEKQLTTQTNTLIELAKKHRQARADLKQAEETLASLKVKLEESQIPSPGEATLDEGEIEQLNRTKRELQTAIDKLTAEKRASEDSVRKVKQEYERGRQESAKFKQQIARARQDATRARQDTDKARRETTRARQDTAKARRDKAKVDGEIRRLKQQKDALTRDVNRMNSERKSAEDKQRRAEVEVTKIQQQKRQAEADLAALQKRRGDLDNEVWKLTAQKLTVENALKGDTTHGLQATYFKSRDLSGPGVQRIDPVINFDWKDRGPMAELGGDNFSVRWEGQLEAPASGTFTLHTVSNDGVRLWVNGKRIIDQWNQQSRTEHKGTIELKAGQRYNVRMEFFEAAGTATAQLAWSGPGWSRTIVPTTNLFPKTVNGAK
jgi:hypothetical protein